jgi:hypothetical protein
MRLKRLWRPVIVVLVLLLAVVGGVATAQDVITTDGPLTTGLARLYRDFGDFQTEMISLAPYDSVSGAPYFLDVAHYEIHYGGMFHAEFVDDSVADDGTVDVLLRTGASADHAIFEVAVGGQSSVQMFEAPEVGVAGTEISSLNMNRLITRTAETLLYHTPTITATGAITMVDRIIPAGATAQTRVGGQSSKGVEWVLAPSTDYLLRITNTSGGAVPVSVMFEWYEGDE